MQSMLLASSAGRLSALLLACRARAADERSYAPPRELRQSRVFGAFQQQRLSVAGSLHGPRWCARLPAVAAPAPAVPPLLGALPGTLAAPAAGLLAAGLLAVPSTLTRGLADGVCALPRCGRAVGRARKHAGGCANALRPDSSASYAASARLKAARSTVCAALDTSRGGEKCAPRARAHRRGRTPRSLGRRCATARPTSGALLRRRREPVVPSSCAGLLGAQRSCNYRGAPPRPSTGAAQSCRRLRRTCSTPDAIERSSMTYAWDLCSRHRVPTACEAEDGIPRPSARARAFARSLMSDDTSRSSSAFGRWDATQAGSHFWSGE